MTGESGAHTNRPELVANHGYDAMFAMHALRLGIQGFVLQAFGSMRFWTSTSPRWTRWSTSSTGCATRTIHLSSRTWVSATGGNLWTW